MKRKSMVFAAVLLAVMAAPLWAQSYEIKQNADNTVTITGIGSYSELYYLEIPSTLSGLKVTAIGDGVFSDIPIFGIFMITSLEIPDTITSIGAKAFNNSALQGLIIPATVRRIGAEAFGGALITTVVIPASLSPGTNGQLGSSSKGAFEGEWYEERKGYSSITLPAGMDTTVVKNNFGESLGNFYVSQGKTAGTYVKDGAIWVKRQPGSARTYFDSGKTAYDTGRYGTAIADFIQAVQLDPNNGTYKEALRNAQKRFCANKITGRNAIRATFSNDELYYNALIANYTKAIRIDPNYAEAYAKRAQTYGEKGDEDKAIADYTQAIRLDPNNNTYKEALKNVQNREAQQEAQQAVAARQYLESGNAAFKSGNYDRAIANYTEAIRLDPNNKNAYNNRAFAYDEKGDYDRAIADFTEAIRLDSKDKVIYNYRATAYYRKGDYDRAIADFTEAIRLDPNSAPNSALYYNNRGNSYCNKRDYDKAIADYTQAIRLDPNSAWYYYSQRALAYIGKRDYNRAIADATEAIRLDPNFATPYRHRGYAYMMKRNFKQARADTNESLQLDPNNQEAKDLDTELRRKGY